MQYFLIRFAFLTDTRKYDAIETTSPKDQFMEFVSTNVNLFV